MNYTLAYNVSLNCFNGEYVTIEPKNVFAKLNLYGLQTSGVYTIHILQKIIISYNAYNIDKNEK